MSLLVEELNDSDPDKTLKIDSLCQICIKNKFKYKCPRCSLKTCSLECCRTHKTNTGCTGQRDKTKFVSKEEFNESHLINDYRFLEEQSRIIDAYQRAAELGEEHILNGKTLSSNTLDSDALKNNLAYGVFENLRKFVHKQFNICLKLMPAQSTRHLNNKTRFNRATNVVSWSIEFAFHLESNSSKNKRYFRVDSKKILFSMNESVKNTISNFYSKFKNDLFDKTKFKYENNEQKLKELYEFCDQFKNLFEKEDFKDLNVLFQIEDFKLRKKYFIKFDWEKSLVECLKNRSLIEYPTLYLVKNENLNEYEIIEEEKVKEVETSNKQEEDNQKAEAEAKDKAAQEEEEDEGEMSESGEEESDEKSLNSSKRIKLDESSFLNQSTSIKDQNNDQSINDTNEFSDELEEGEERD